jgi:macrolide transport system ATP-binding/permease protein
MELIRVENICKTYYLGEVDVPVLHGVSLSIRRGEVVALKGVSGSGKTTLMNILGCLDRPTSGKYWFDGADLSELAPDDRALVRAAKIGFVFQNFNLLARTSALHNVLMPLDYCLVKPSPGEAQRRGHRVLTEVGLADRLDHEPSQMSGGQQQRVAIARALVNKPALVLADEPTGNLDSHTSVEILKMFRQLSDEGITVLLVTHDPKVAAWADRTISISDGLIESDESAEESAAFDEHTANGDSGSMEAWSPLGGSSSGGPLAVAAEPTSAQAVAEICEQHDSLESDVERDSDEDRLSVRARLSSLVPATVRSAMTDLSRNKLRSGLTTLGIVIGIGAVIAMVEIGQGSATAVRKTIATLGANIVQVDPNWAMVGGVNMGAGSRVTLTPDDAEAIRRECTAVRYVAPVIDINMQIIYGSRNWLPRIILGSTPEYFHARDWTLAEGAFFSDDDVLRASAVCVLGQTPARALFPDESPLGKKVRVRNVMLRVVGVLGPKGANMMGLDQDDFIICPMTTVKFRLSSTRAAHQPAAAAAQSQVNSLSDLYPSQQAPLYLQRTAAEIANNPQMVRFFDLDDIFVSAESPEDVPRLMTDITRVLRKQHRLAEDAPDDFRIRDLAEVSKALASSSEVMTNLLLCVALISLCVGGIGIMNIMLVSVTERTREIGLRMAVGARRYHILRQFLVEAVILCVIGGVVGILIGRGASIAVRHFMRWPTEASLVAIIAAVAVSMAAGIVFGFYPAWKASRLDPIESLRYE